MSYIADAKELILVISFRFHFFNLLVFFCRATSWHVHGLSYKAEEEDRYDLPIVAFLSQLIVRFTTIIRMFELCSSILYGKLKFNGFHPKFEIAKQY